MIRAAPRTTRTAVAARDRDAGTDVHVGSVETFIEENVGVLLFASLGAIVGGGAGLLLVGGATAGVVGAIVGAVGVPYALVVLAGARK